MAREILVASAVNGEPVQVTPQLLDQLAAAANLSDEGRAMVDQTIAVFGWSFALAIDGLVNHRGRVHEEKTDVPRPAPPEGAAVPYIVARLSTTFLVD